MGKHNRRSLNALLAGCALLLAYPGAVFAASATEENALEDIPEEYQPREAELRFIPSPPSTNIPISRNTLRVTEQSMRAGWVELEQCHENLDRFPRAEIVYQYHQMRGLEIETTDGIDKAWVEGQTVQLVDVADNAKLCITARVNILRKRPDGTFVLENGPFHRKFLDGYFPMRVVLTVHYPDEGLRFQGLEPEPRDGFVMQHEAGEIHIDAHFSGKLLVRMHFSHRN